MGEQGFDYYYGDESGQFSFYRIPRQLITGARFKRLSTDAKLQYELQPSRDNPDVRETMKEQAQAVGQWEERNHIPFDRRLTQCIGIGVYTCKTRVTPAQLAERHRIAVDLPLVPRFRPKIKKPQQIEER